MLADLCHLHKCSGMSAVVDDEVCKCLRKALAWTAQPCAASSLLDVLSVVLSLRLCALHRTALSRSSKLFRMGAKE